MTTPTRFDDTDRTQPAIPPPTKKNDAQAKNTTQMGTVMTSAVSATASPPRTPMLSVNAVRESMGSPPCSLSCEIRLTSVGFDSVTLEFLRPSRADTIHANPDFASRNLAVTDARYLGVLPQMGATRGQHQVSDEKTRKTVVFALYDKVTLQDVAAPLEIFARANDFGARYEVILASLTGKAVDTTSFVALNVETSLAEVPDRIDTLIVPGGVPADFTFTPGEHDIPEEQTPDVVASALDMVRELAPRARRVASVFTGAFVLAALGLLDGRRATTHWAHCQELARAYPHISVDPDSLFVQDGPFITGAGISAGIDLGLALVESDYGPDVARRVARWMVVFLQRPGGQAQFSVWTEAELPVSGGLREILDAVVADPGADHSIAAMADRAAVSERHLVRMFRVQVGMTPARFVEQARLEAAKVLLATGDHGQEAVARRAGFGSADTMRRTFRRALGVSPSMYRSRFRTTGVRSTPTPVG